MPLLFHGNRKSAPKGTHSKQQHFFRSDEPGGTQEARRLPPDRSLVLAIGPYRHEMTLDYLFLAIETILCSQGSFRCVLGI